jgi:hypothetical protein
VKPFIDLIGASGAAYRFRKAEGGLSPIGGNFVYVRDVDGMPRVVCCGKARSIGWVLTKRTWFDDENGEPGDQLYVRLNATGTIRRSEHEDLVAGLPRPFTIYEIE